MRAGFGVPPAALLVARLSDVLRAALFERIENVKKNPRTPGVPCFISKAAVNRGDLIYVLRTKQKAGCRESSPQGVDGLQTTTTDRKKTSCIQKDKQYRTVLFSIETHEEGRHPVTT